MRTTISLDPDVFEAAQAMGAEVRWSQLLGDLSTSLPADVSLTSFTATVEASLPGASTTTTAAANAPTYVGALGHQGIGQIQYAGEARGFRNVADFIDTQARQMTLTDSYVNGITRASQTTSGTTSVPVMTFTSTAVITDTALSHRYDQKAGN